MGMTKPSEPQEPLDEFPGSTTRHGTTGGWTRHQKLGESPCDPCYRAKEQYDKDYSSQPHRVQRDRMFAKAQQRAQTALKALHPEEYRELYEAAKAQLDADS